MEHRRRVIIRGELQTITEENFVANLKVLRSEFLLKAEGNHE